MSEPLGGDFACVNVGGDVGRLIRLGEELNGDGFTQYQHAYVYIGGGLIVEAEPGGAVPVKLTGDLSKRSLWSTGRITLTADQRVAVCAAALRYVGTPYSFLDYAALAAHRLHIPAPGLRAFIRSSRSMICSQLVDQCYQDAGVHLFADGRWPGYVTPASLAGVIESA